MSIIHASTPEEAAEAVRAHARVIAAGAGSKPALRSWRGSGEVAQIRPPSGLIEYDPGEYTFTALAGTSLREISAALEREGQHLPFDPMFLSSATLGGTLASGMNGPGRLRYGGLRDFVIGVQFADGEGTLLRGGGKVVKNAAGLDFPKLLCGSLGRLGLITEASFKVFPKPESSLTALSPVRDLAGALRVTRVLAGGPHDLDAIEWLPDRGLVIRIAGHAAALPARLEALRKASDTGFEIVPPSEAALLWQTFNDWKSASPGVTRLKIALTPATARDIEQALADIGVPRRYSVAFNIAFVELADASHLERLDSLLASCRASALLLDGPGGRLGCKAQLLFEQRLKSVLDPANKFGDLP
jgi:glycolate oxidase FAD binding subunit